MIAKRKRQNAEPLQVGDLIIEDKNENQRQRIGEVIFVREGGSRVLEVVEVNRHDLAPRFSLDMQHQKTFRLNEDQCERLNVKDHRPPSTFGLGQIIKKTTPGRTRYGIIVGFQHPDGLYSKSYEQGYNGKDLLECVEVSPREGLARKTLPNGKPNIFYSTPKRAETCEVLPMDENGGVRLKKEE